MRKFNPIGGCARAIRVSTAIHIFYACLLLVSPTSVADAAPLTITGSTSAHDPSTINKLGNTYYYFATGNGISAKRSTNLTAWSSAPAVFSTPPAWTTAAVPGFNGTFWAPDVSYFNGKYNLYYSVSTFGSQVSAIGLATNTTLDSNNPNYQWVDQGPVIQSQVGSAYNTIDADIFNDEDGRVWMNFGSFWNGIYQVELDPMTGKRKNNNAPTQLANKSQIEAASMVKRGQYYYLFLNWGLCCQGVSSTYNIRVGRSTSANGPFTDANGINLASGGGTLLLGSTGKYIGPGHFSLFSEAGRDYFSYHYYDGNNNGAARFGISDLYWTEAGWPSTVPEPACISLLAGAGIFLLRRARR